MRPGNGVIPWLLEDKDPSVKYRTLVEVLDRPEADPEVRQAQARIPASKEVSRIFSRLGPDGLWPHKPEYYGTFTTIEYLTALAELGMTRSDARIAHIVEWYFQSDYGQIDLSVDSGCRQIPMIRTLVCLGYLEDERVQRCIEQLRQGIRFDGGLLCLQFKSHKKYAGRVPKSCMRASENALWAVASVPPAARSHPDWTKLTDYFLRRRVIYSTGDPAKVIGLAKSSYPVYGLAHYLYSLSALGYGRHPALDDLWQRVEVKRDAQGRYLQEYPGSKPPFNPGKVGQPSKWITMYMVLAWKYREER